jgi:hypothetical protein
MDTYPILGLAIAALLLASCPPKPTEKETVAQCKLDAMKAYPGQNMLMSDDMNSFVLTCMQAHGFEWQDTDDFCKKAGAGNFRAFPGCYQRVAD